MSKKPTYYITTAIIYTSGKPHIGNMVDMLIADSLARFKKKQGYDVFFMTGTDEHGIKNEENAKKAGLTPKNFVDSIATQIAQLLQQLNIEYDKFIRTTDADHMTQVQKIFEKLYAQGDIYKGSYEGLYCTPCEAFWTPSQLIDGHCPDCGREVQMAKEEAYFFKMQKYTAQLLQFYQENENFFIPSSRKNEMMRTFIETGLQDLCVSRTSFTWGVPVSFDKKHVVYVWLDALSNYITGLGYDADGNHSDNYKKYWPADVHIIGKDIVRFHTIYWPTMLMALGQPLPKAVFGHPWLLMGGNKMSKSRGNVLYSDEMVAIFGTDVIRYAVLSELPFDNDGNITWESVTDCMNTDLVNTLGNLVSRTISMTNQYLSGYVASMEQTTSVDNELFSIANSLYAKVQNKIEQYKINEALAEIFTLLRRCNKYIDETTPWILAKDSTQAERLATVLANLVNCIMLAANLLYPILPETATKIAQAFHTPLVEDYANLSFPLVTNGTKMQTEGLHLFQRRSIKDIQKILEEQQSTKQNNAVHKEDKLMEYIDLNTLDKVQLKVGEVIHCEKIEKANKLLKLIVQIGEEKRIIVSGIAKSYAPQEMIGKRVVVVTNLKPVKLHGILSEGMLLCAENNAKELSLLTTDSAIESGSTIH